MKHLLLCCALAASLLGCNRASEAAASAATSTASLGLGLPLYDSFDKTTDGVVIPTPAGYTFSKAGIWVYKEAKLFSYTDGVSGANVVAELYKFNVKIEAETAQADCDRAWNSDGSQGLPTGCYDEGGACAEIEKEDGTIVLICCD